MLESMVIVLPHSPKEFKTKEKLAEFIGTDLKSDGKYALATVKTKHKVLGRGSICLFMKSKVIVGEGKLSDPVRKYRGKEISPVTGKPYEGMLVFEPFSLRRYVHPLDLTTIHKVAGKNISFRSGGNLTWEQYGKCLYEVAKKGFY